jgi:uncharacterized damage-inducible protein DinB
MPVMARYDLDVPSGLAPDVALLVAAWRDSAREWLGEVGEVPDEAVTRRHGRNGVSVGALLMHMVDCDEVWIERVVLGLASPPPSVAGEFCRSLSVERREFPDPPSWPFAQYIGLLRDTRERLVAGLAGLSGSQEVVSASGNVFTVRWVLAHLIQHDSYHGGQIVLLLEEFGDERESQSRGFHTQDV